MRPIRPRPSLPGHARLARPHLFWPRQPLRLPSNYPRSNAVAVTMASFAPNPRRQAVRWVRSRRIRVPAARPWLRSSSLSSSTGDVGCHSGRIGFVRAIFPAANTRAIGPRMTLHEPMNHCIHYTIEQQASTIHLGTHWCSVDAMSGSPEPTQSTILMVMHCHSGPDRSSDSVVRIAKEHGP